MYFYLDPDGCADGERRIVSGSNGNDEVEGRVEVCFNGLWGAVYSTQWDQSQAGVICNGLGYEPSGKCMNTCMLVNQIMEILLFILGAVALLPARPLPDIPPPQVVWPVIITCKSSDPNASLDTCSIELTDTDISNQFSFSRPLQSFVAGFQCRKGMML